MPSAKLNRSRQSLSVCAASVVAAKLDSLRQRQLGGKIDRVRLASHVLLPAIASAFAAAAGLFLAAECAPDLRAARTGIYIRDSAIASGCAHESFRFACVVG